MIEFECATGDGTEMKVGGKLDEQGDLYFRRLSEDVYLSTEDVAELRDHLSTVLGDRPVAAAESPVRLSEVEIFEARMCAAMALLDALDVYVSWEHLSLVMRVIANGDKR
jgi:hypothetical protein